MSGNVREMKGGSFSLSPSGKKKAKSLAPPSLQGMPTNPPV